MSTQQAARMPESDSQFLAAISNGKHRKGSGPRLRKLIATSERLTFGAVACFCCGHAVTASKSTIEHITPQSLGGTWAFDNLALSHDECNLKRGNTPTQRAPIAATGAAQ